ncbi:hypothetical protein Btru_047963 [Bulinus truncatus]|nr:hypothetical protein Btru_047963 [Bulinus truncatus]
MLLCVLLTLPAFIGSLAQQVPCNTGKAVCESSESLSVVSNDYFCCDQGFNMQWNNKIVNGSAQTECLCNRHYYVSDCIEDQLQCEGATSFTTDGFTVKCCRSGESMNSVYNSMINGVRADYCKCIKYVTGASNGGGGSRRQRPSNNRQRNGINYRGGPLGISQMAGQFLETLSRGIQDSLASLGNDPALQNVPNVDLPLNQQTRPRPSWQLFSSFPQRMFQLMQPRRLPQGIRGVANVFDRVGQNPGVMQFVDPNWWLNQDWRGVYRNDSPQRQRTGDSTTVSPVTVKSTTSAQAVL